MMEVASMHSPVFGGTHIKVMRIKAQGSIVQIMVYISFPLGGTRKLEGRGKPDDSTSVREAVFIRQRGTAKARKIQQDKL
jgi:hypothetical protein